MNNGNNNKLYVAEMKLPTCFYAGTEQRHGIPNPKGFDITHGYYVMRPPTKQSVLAAHPEIAIVMRFISSNLKEAEDHALRVGRLLSSLSSAYGGYPLEEPYLNRIGLIDVEGKLKSQHCYLYGPKPYMLAKYDQSVGHQFQKYLNSVSTLDAQTRRQLQTAIHWYVISISSDDSPVSYVAAWTGLESVGPVLDRVAHPHGSKARCKICGNESGAKRDSKKAGVNHMFNRISCGTLPASLEEKTKEALDVELLKGFTAEKANDLRDAIVHGLGDIEQLTKECSQARRHLMHVLNASIQSILGPYVKSWMTGDYEFHPIHRASIKCNELANKSPYYGEWFNGPQFDSQSAIEEGERILSTRFSLKWEFDPGLVEFASKEGFRRDTDVFGPDGSEISDFPKWHDRPVEPPWKDVTEIYGDK